MYGSIKGLYASIFFVIYCKKKKIYSSWNWLGSERDTELSPNTIVDYSYNIVYYTFMAKNIGRIIIFFHDIIVLSHLVKCRSKFLYLFILCQHSMTMIVCDAFFFVYIERERIRVYMPVIADCLVTMVTVRSTKVTSSRIYT